MRDKIERKKVLPVSSADSSSSTLDSGIGIFQWFNSSSYLRVGHLSFPLVKRAAASRDDCALQVKHSSFHD